MFHDFWVWKYYKGNFSLVLQADQGAKERKELIADLFVFKHHIINEYLLKGRFH